MVTNFNNLKIFAANSHPELAYSIANHLGVPPGCSETILFSDGEIGVSIFETVRGCDVFIVQSTCAPVNNNLMELLIMADAFKRASAGRITAVIPYFGYARQDRKAKARDPISAKLVADLITVAGVDRILTMDLHAPQIQGFFNIPLDHLAGSSILAPYFINKFKNTMDNTVVVSPDLGSVARARVFAQRCKVPLAMIDKRRTDTDVSEVCNIIGDVKDKTVILLDDVIDTAGTICNSAKAVIETGGAKEVYVCATHGVLSGEAVKRLKASVVKEFILLDTIPIPVEKRLDNLTVLSAAKLFSDAIKCVYEEKSISFLYSH
ncbi:MAG: ribose-phosphate pyrophosphokinase [Oscillospiraceae bacterium]|nr:ribose-phosphate pyrophosphokinase [Oscillospiraceae bacterium]